MSRPVSQTAPIPVERAGRGAGLRPAAALDSDPGRISAAAVARSRTLGEARWAPGGDPAGVARGLRGPGRPRGGAGRRVAGPRSRSPPEFPVHRRSAPTAAAGTAGSTDDDAGLRRRRRPPARDPGDRRCRCGCSRATGAPPRRRSSPDGRPGRVRARARRRVRRRGGRRSTAAAGRAGVSHADYAWDPVVVGRRRHARVARVGPPEHAVGRRRASCASRSTADDDAVSGRGRRRRRGRPAALLAGRRRARVRRRRDGLDERVGRAEPTATRRRGARRSRTSTPSRRGVRASGRSRGRPTARAIALNRNEDGFGRLVRRRGSTRSAPRATLVEGLARAASTGASRGIACIRSGGRTPPQLTVLDPDDAAPARRVARGAPAELDAVDLPEPDAGHAGPATTARPCTGSCGCRRRRRSAADVAPADARRRARRTDRPGDRRLEAARRAASSSRGWAVLAPNYRGSTGYGRDVPRRRSTDAWGELDVADTVAGIRAAGRDGWADAVARRGDGWQRRRLHRAARRRARTPRVVRAVVSLFGVTDLFDLAATTHRFESRYLDRLVGDAARARRPLPRALAGHARARDITVPVLVLQGADDKVVPPAQAQLLVDSMRAAGGDRRAPRVRRRGPRVLPGGDRSSTRSSASTTFLDADGWCNDDRPLVTEYEWQGPKRGADRAVLLAHGAGSDLHGAGAASRSPTRSPTAKIPSLRFNYPYRSRGPQGARPAQGARRRDPRGGGRAREAGEAPARSARARRPVDGRPLLLDGRRRRRRPGPGARPADARRTRCTPPGKPEQPRDRPLPAASDARRCS